MHKLKPGILFLLCSILFLSINCSSNKNASNPSTPEKFFDKKKVLVLLQPGVRAKALIKEFSNYGLASKGQISRTENRFMFSYDTSTIDPDALLSTIQGSELVIEASFPEIIKKARVSKMNR